MNPCIVIPFYNHGSRIREVLEDVAPMHLPCFVIDDGSDAENRALLTEAAAALEWVRVERHAENRGKGAALKTAYRRAALAGYSHVLQLDADGQHDARDLPLLLEQATACPTALVLAAPIFENAPASRRYGRQISRFWVWVETRSFAITDPLCGLRCMPLASTCRVLDDVPCGDRMEFDPEIAVRLVWAGVPVRNVPSRVRYVPGNVSHFQLWRDNVRITRLHTGLFFGMLLRALRILRDDRRMKSA